MIRESLDPEAEIIFGTTINEDLTDQVVVTVIATGLEDEEAPVPQPQPQPVQQQQQPFGSRRVTQQQRVSSQPVQQPQQQPIQQQQQPMEENKPTRRFADLDDFESEIKIPDFLTRKRF